MKVSSAFSKTVFILIAVVLSAVVIAGVAYYATMPVTTPTTSPTTTTTTPTSPTTTPTITTQTTTTETQTTQTQTETTTVTTTGISPIVNLRVGSYVKYLQRAYMDEDIFESYITFHVKGEERYNNVNCLLLSMVMEAQRNGVRMKEVITWWLSKMELKMMHAKIQFYHNDELIYESEPSPYEVREEESPPEPIDVNYFVGYESVTVPAGTFINCIKVEVSEKESLMKTWAHPNVPIYGLVKFELYKAGSLKSVMELISYGG